MMAHRPENHLAEAGTEPDAPQLDPKVQGAIGHALQAHFDQIVNAPLPDRFLVLLAELEAKEQHHGG
jgi:hypothetical protein